jgi:hypothetical protein
LCRRNQAKKEGLQLESPTELWTYFVDKTRENLHITLCFSPIGDAFRERLRQFPSLVNCCTIDWCARLPERPAAWLPSAAPAELSLLSAAEWNTIVFTAAWSCNFLTRA